MEHKKLPKFKIYLSNIAMHFDIKSYWWIYLINTIVAIIGVVVGILVARNSNFEDSFDLYWLLKQGEYGYFSIFIKYSFFMLILGLISLISIFNPLFAIFSTILLCYFGYKIGYVTLSSLMLNSSTAILTIILFWLPYIILSIGLSSTITISNLTLNNCVGNVNCCANLIKKSTIIFLYLYILASILILLISIIIPLLWKLIFY